MTSENELWKSPSLVRDYLEEVRGGLPLAEEQIGAMLRVVEAAGGARAFADLGSGSGILAGAVLSKYPKASGVLVDFSEAMLEQARGRLSRYAGQLTFVHADLAGGAWRGAVEGASPFDVVVSGYAIHHFRNDRKRELYREIFQLLAPGGLFVNVDHVSSNSGWIGSISDALHVDSLAAFHAQRETPKSRDEIARLAVGRPDQQANILAPVEAQCDWLRECGFEDVDCYFKIFERAVFGGRRPR